MTGQVWDILQSKCIYVCPSNSVYNTTLTNCNCNVGYGLMNGVCVVCPSNYYFLNGYCFVCPINSNYNNLIGRC